MKIKTIAALAGGTVATAAIMKKNNICPKCVAKNLLSSFKVTDPGADKYNNGVALTPPMGWASW
ncbi:MAG: hypothetical protein IJN59_02645, partial [Oscillospiraceae bacterium]|nr:hypothetical protein [Oscillospiraceae bacterium]